MTTRFHPYAPLAAALALSAASLAAACVGIGPTTPRMAAISIGGDDGPAGETAAAEAITSPATATDRARPAAVTAERVAYLHIDDAGVWVEFAQPANGVQPAPAGAAAPASQPSASPEAAARRASIDDRAGGMAS